MKKLISILLIVTLVVAAFSCTKEKVQNSQDYGKTFIKVHSVDTDGSVQVSSIITTYVKQ